MKRTILGLLIATVLATAAESTALAQAAPAQTPVPAQAPAPAPTPRPPAQAKPLTALKVEVVISRYEGDKKISSLPYILAVTANEGRSVNLRMGSQVPVPKENGGVSYMPVGTNIDCTATSTDDGRFKVEVRIDDSSIMERRGALAPTLRNFNITNAVILRDGQSAQFTAAADKSTGEVVKVDVTLTVEK